MSHAPYSPAEKLMTHSKQEQQLPEEKNKYKTENSCMNLPRFRKEKSTHLCDLVLQYVNDREAETVTPFSQYSLVWWIQFIPSVKENQY